jgi:hypothetical protein
MMMVMKRALSQREIPTTIATSSSKIFEEHSMRSDLSRGLKDRTVHVDEKNTGLHSISIEQKENPLDISHPKREREERSTKANSC